MLKHPQVANKFRAAVKKNLSNDQPQQTIDSSADRIAKSLLEAGKETLAPNCRKLHSWISDHTLELITQRCHLPRHARGSRREVDLAIKESLKKDRADYWHN